MPFDSNPTVEILLPERTRSPGHQRLAQLAEALRQPLPQDFEWDYSVALLRRGRVRAFIHGQCRTAGCAVGLAHTIWPEAELIFDWSRWGPGAERAHIDCDVVEEFFGLSGNEAHDLFSSVYTYGCDYMEAVSQQMVADAIDRFLLTGKVTTNATR